ncbi:MAG TPA: LysR family transcriptional regulator, partial [Oceanospirillaceae bacterium]|nr:LysR family transcriptional regulator [Oceanospirillaceae bacterium]
MRIRNLNSFIKVAKLGSFHVAATQLHTSQPAISARIATLEDELGVRLFKRDQSGTQLTTRGMQLLPFAERLV